MRFVRRAAQAAGFTLLVLALAAPAAASMRRLQVTIVDPDGKPIEGVKVNVSKLGNEESPFGEDGQFVQGDLIKELETDDKGRAAFATVENIRMVDFLFEKEGYRSQIERVKLELGSHKKEYSLTRLSADELRRSSPEAKAAGEAFERGVAAVNASDWQGAAVEFEEVTRLRPELYEAWLNLATARHNLEQWEEAVEAGKQALALNPDLNNANALVADALIRVGRESEARPYQQKVAAVEPAVAAEMAYNRGVALANEGNDAEAAKLFKQALGADPELVEAHYALGLCGLRLGDMEIAREHLGKFAELAPEHPKIAMVKGMLAEIDKSAPQ